MSPFAVQMVMPNGPSATVGLELGARAGVITPVSACSSGSEAIAHAYRMLVMGDADIIVAGGVEGYLDAVPIASFAMMRALSTRNDDPKAASRPFDKDRDGFVFGEAGAMMVLETEEHAKLAVPPSTPVCWARESPPTGSTSSLPILRVRALRGP